MYKTPIFLINLRYSVVSTDIKLNEVAVQILSLHESSFKTILVSSQAIISGKHQYQPFCELLRLPVWPLTINNPEKQTKMKIYELKEDYSYKKARSKVFSKVNAVLVDFFFRDCLLILVEQYLPIFDIFKIYIIFYNCSFKKLKFSQAGSNLCARLPKFITFFLIKVRYSVL